ncbi:MAG: F0F1 ATP synthase subunit delta [Proteobacteria bacterium]|nr:F0F1 ATP synthase subunit delta [Pseudomonadota bacterium]
MSEPLTLARPYARAAFETARAHNALAAWSGNLRFAAQVMADARVSAVAGDPRLSHAELVGLLLPPGEAAETPFAAFLGLLVENRRVNLLAEITALFEELKRESECTIRVTLRSASEIAANQAEAIKVALKKRFAREIELEQHIDPTVIGGAVIDAGDVVIDGSVRGRLERLENALTQ